MRRAGRTRRQGRGYAGRIGRGRDRAHRTVNRQLNCVTFTRYDKARAEARDRNAIPTAVFVACQFLMKDLLQRWRANR